jgi:hypothetical protein
MATSVSDRGGGRPIAERIGLVAEIVLAYLRSRRELRRASIESVVARMRATGALRGSPRLDLEEARRLGWIVTRTLAFLPGDTRCLRRSLVLLALLARRGIGARLVIGVRSDPEFLAHAWVECGGQPVLTPLGASFGRLVEL